LDLPSEITVTGGEPFLRKDLGSVINGAMKLRSVGRMSICSNGSFPDRISEVCESACRRHQKPLHLLLSLDGLPMVHGRIRHDVNGSSKVIEACERAKHIQKKYGHFSFHVSCVVMKDNISGIGDLVDDLQERGIPSQLTFVRGNAFSTFGVSKEILAPDYGPVVDVAIPPARLRRLIQKIEQDHPGYFSFLQKKKLNIMLKTLTSKKRQIDCYAGYGEGVLFSNGDIGLCEQVRPFGNLAQWGWDLRKAWNSAEAIRQRMLLRNCACLHGCNITTSLLHRWRRTIKGRSDAACSSGSSLKP
jgi:sulfatase maturation enzyme AslB (radical SAM superfamily)